MDLLFTYFSRLLLRRISHYRFDFVPQNNTIERPTPVLFICGEGLHVQVWDKTAKYLCAKGYSGGIMELPTLTPPYDIYKSVDYLQQTILEAKFTPPILVTHSVSTFIAQKFLESYSASALVMVDPIPPIHNDFMKKLIAKYSQAPTPAGYYNSTPSSIFQETFPIDFMRYLCKDSTINVSLERAVVPMLVISSTKEDMMREYHQIDESNVIYLPSNERLATLQSDSFHETLHTWIEDNT